MAPKVSVVIPTHDRAAFLREALESVTAQTETDWECLVADDRSGPETERLLDGLAARDPRIRRVAVRGGTPARARNAVLAGCRGDHVAFLDDDDLWLPDKLSIQLAALAADEETVLVCGRVEEFGARMAPWPAGEVPEVISFERLLAGNLVATSAAMVRRSALEQVGHFDESLTMAEDFELWLRLALRGRVRFMDRLLCRYRVHPGSISHDERAMQRSLETVVRLLYRRGDIDRRALRRQLRAICHNRWLRADGAFERFFWRLRRGYYFDAS